MWQVFLGYLIGVVYWLWSSTWRAKIIEPPELKEALENGQPLIFAHWHGDELAIVHLVRRYRLATMTSTSKDGELMDRAIRLLGGKTSRGSSTRGAVRALKGLVHLCREGHPASIAVDGPKGPRFVIKNGVFQLSRLAQAPIFAVGVAARPAHIFERAWNKAHLPWPFARVVVTYSAPIMVEKDHSENFEKETEVLATSLKTVHQEAAKLID